MLHSVVIPVYNSAQSIGKIVERLLSTFEQIAQSVEIVLVDDCSLDDSWKVLLALKQKHLTKIKLIKLSKNFGQHQAIFCGLQHTTGDLIITLDDDGQNPPEEIPHLLKKIKTDGADLCYGVYEKKQHHLFRNLSSRIVQIIFKSIFNNKGDVTAFRCFTKQLKDKITTTTQNNIYLDGLMHWHTSKVCYATVAHKNRLYGNSNYSILKLLKLAANLIFNFTTLPLRLLVFFGALSSVISFALGLFYIIRRFLKDDAPLGFTPLMVSIFFLASALMFGLGVIGEYLKRIYVNQNSMPAYSIDVILLD